MRLVLGKSVAWEVAGVTVPAAEMTKDHQPREVAEPAGKVAKSYL